MLIFEVTCTNKLRKLQNLANLQKVRLRTLIQRKLKVLIKLQL